MAGRRSDWLDRPIRSSFQNIGIIISTGSRPQQHNFLPTMYRGNLDLEQVFAKQDDLEAWTKKSPISSDISEKNRISVVLEKILGWKNRK